MNPHVYILILNWNGKDVLIPCLKSVFAIDYPNYTIMVIDNDSSDGSVEMAKDIFQHIEYLQLEQNFGFAGGYNKCFDYLRDKDPEYILLLNNDTEVEPNILHSFVKAKEQYGNNHIFGGKIYYQHNPHKIWYAGGRVNLKFGMISHRGIRKIDSEKYSFPSITDYVTGCCLFTYWNVIDQLKGFDETFTMYGEDVDLCNRAKQMGIQCYYWPDAILWHHVSASGGTINIKKYCLKLLAIIKLIIKQISYEISKYK